MNWSVLKGHSGGRRHVWLLLGLLSAAIPLAAATDLIYVTNRGGTTIDVIDARTNKVVQSIGNIESPEVVRFSPDGRLLWADDCSFFPSSTLGALITGVIRARSL